LLSGRHVKQQGCQTNCQTAFSANTQEGKKENNMSQADLLTAIATAAEQLRNGTNKTTVAADLERLVIELQKGE
jgi:hypothetical protein